VLAVVQNARRLRGQRSHPTNVAWCLWTDELEPGKLALAMRYALEFGQRRRLERRLERMRTLADVGSIAGGVAHEIGNPLTSLLTNIEFARGRADELLRAHADCASLIEALHDAHDGARHISRIAGDLGRASRQAGRVAHVDTRSVLETAVRLAAEPLVRVEVRRRYRRVPLVRADESRLCQVLLNLLKNAAEALGDTPDPEVIIEVRKVDDDVMITVADNGPGIPDEVAARLFDPWFTTRAEGTGLGLALSRRFIEEMDGRLEVTSAPGQGAAFHVRLPAAASERVSAPTLVPDRGVSGVPILVVDDAPLIRRAFHRALAGQQVTLADGAEEALCILDGGATFVLVFIDLHMPGRSGIDFYEELCERHPGSVKKVVFLSGAFSQQDLAWLDQRNLPWVRKPVGAHQLRDLVGDLLTSPRS
jgi:signal transduction histidine kinase